MADNTLNSTARPWARGRLVALPPFGGQVVSRFGRARGPVRVDAVGRYAIALGDYGTRVDHDARARAPLASLPHAVCQFGP